MPLHGFRNYVFFKQDGEIVTNGLTVYLDAGNILSYSGSGSTWSDISGNSRNFSLSNTSFDSSGNGCIVFNGSNALATISHTQTAIFRRTDAISYEFFCYKQSGGSDNIAGSNISGGQGTGGMTISQSQSIFAWTPSNPASDRNILSSFSENKQNKWVHVVFTVNYSTNAYAMYENSISLTATPSSTWTTMAPSSSSFLRADSDAIGGRYVNSWTYWSGKIAICRMYSRALTSSEVLQNFNANRWRYGI